MTADDLFRVGHTQPVEIAAFEFVAVARNVYIIEIEREAQQRQQLAGKYHGTAHYGQQQRVLVTQIAADGVGHFLQGGAAFGFVEQ